MVAGIISNIGCLKSRTSADRSFSYGAEIFERLRTVGCTAFVNEELMGCLKILYPEEKRLCSSPTSYAY